MAPQPLKKYTITGSHWPKQTLTIQHDGLPFLWVNANNKYGPWKAPYITLHSDSPSGPIVAAAKMGLPGCARNFRIFLGNPDCTDLNTWPLVDCRGKSAYEYRFSVGGQDFAWRRTRNKQLGARGKGHRDFKLIALGPPPAKYQEVLDPTMDGEKCLLNSVIDDAFEDELTPVLREKDIERVLAIYYMDTRFTNSSREAKLNFFESLPAEVELWCLAAVLGLQEKISKNRDAFWMSSASYGGCLCALGNYI